MKEGLGFIKQWESDSVEGVAELQWGRRWCTHYTRITISDGRRKKVVASSMKYDYKKGF